MPFLPSSPGPSPISIFPKRIVSLVPSISELLVDIGLIDELVGVTKFCVHPFELRKSKTVIGGTKQVHIDKIKELQPDLIIANKEENVREQVEELAKDFPVCVTDVYDLPSALQLIKDIGESCGRKEAAIQLYQELDSELEAFPPRIPQRACYLIWKDPYMTAGGDTFIHSMMQIAGFENVFADHLRYPEVDLSVLSSMQCDVVLLSSEPYPFKEKHSQEIQQFVGDIPIMLVDGEMFSWYGSRPLKAIQYFKSINFPA